VTCADPVAAVEVVAKAAPDLILLDITMPELDGYEVLRALQIDPRTAPYPVVFLTGRREFTERVRAFRHGAVDYVAKPFTREILLRKVEKILETLDARAGSVSETGPQAAQRLMADVTREARSGVLTLHEPEGDHKVVISAGAVVEGSAGEASGADSRAEFQELDSRREGIVPNDPAALSGQAGDAPDFLSLPESLRSIVIVDDNDALRDFLARLLGRLGLHVHQARDGEQALEIIFAERPWLIVTDTKMPRMDGFELCRRVRSHSLVGHTPVVFLSGWDDYANRYRALELGADEYISKSAPVRELLMRLHLLLARYATLGSANEGGRMRGGLDAVGAVGLIQMCHLTRLTGLLSLRSGTRLVEMRWREGEIVAAESDRGVGVPVLHEVLGWTRGFFDFTRCAIAESETLGPFTQLLLEGCRLLDERRRNAREA
jgi:DNA-binding response OmpR family regulator